LAGVSCPPVMAVVRLSKMMTTEEPPFHTMLSSPVMPEWKKVESPMTDTLRFFLSCAASPRAFSMPWAVVTPAPMHTSECSALKGGWMPSV